jgi:hypothetical protein
MEIPVTGRSLRRAIAMLGCIGACVPFGAASAQTDLKRNDPYTSLGYPPINSGAPNPSASRTNAIAPPVYPNSGSQSTWTYKQNPNAVRGGGVSD